MAKSIAIIANAGTAEVAIFANRPSWKDMKYNYPDTTIDTSTLYDKKIGGKFVELYNQTGYANTCAVRMSYALNRSGMKLGESPNKGGSILGGDKYSYWIRVSELRNYLANRFKLPDEQLDLTIISQSKINDTEYLTKEFKLRVAQAEEFIEKKVGAKSGIVVFEVSGWTDATGHFTLWDSSEKKLLYAPGHDSPSDNKYYFWLTMIAEDKDKNKKIIQTTKVKFWELK